MTIGAEYIALNMDAENTAFFARELESVKSKTYDIIKAPLKGFQLVPVDSTAGSGAESIVYQQFDETGLAKVIANYADDLPRADVVGKEFTALVKSIGNSYGYNLQEIRAAQHAGRPLAQRKSSAATRAQRELWNKICFYGDATNNLPGFLTNPNIPVEAAPAGAGGGTTFASKTPDEIIADLNKVANTIVTTTNEAERPNTLVMPVDQYAYISSTPRSPTTDTTILQFFLANNEYISSIMSANEVSAAQLAANGVTNFTGDIMIAYDRNPDKLTFEMPQGFEQLPVQSRNLEMVVPCHSRVAGVLWYYPLSARIMEGI